MPVYLSEDKPLQLRLFLIASHNAAGRHSPPGGPDPVDGRSPFGTAAYPDGDHLFRSPASPDTEAYSLSGHPLLRHTSEFPGRSDRYVVEGKHRITLADGAGFSHGPRLQPGYHDDTSAALGGAVPQELTKVRLLLRRGARVNDLPPRATV